MTVTDTDIKTTAGRHAAYVALTGLLGAVVAVVFTISFYGLRDYGQHVAGLPWYLAPLVPVGVDVLSLCGLAATYLLRHAPWHVRAYAWSVFGTAIAASVAGNLSHASRIGLSREGMAGAALAPIFLALASHLVVVTRRHLDRAVKATAPAGADSAPDPLSHLDPAGTDPDGLPARQPHNATDDTVRDDAIRRYAAGETYAEIAAACGVSRKSVERWTAPLRQRAARHGAGRRNGRVPAASTAVETTSADSGEDH